ncbi:hypothetical protein C8R43DRAFT_1127886 [Mycena crocata]|nr:hypothetical protein C8R43DRAFT_1127886 [Mycena crocata]
MLSTLSLVSLSSKSLVGLFGSMFIGAQVTFTVVLSGLSVPKTSLLSATPTREIALLPTKCVLSSGFVLFPRVCTTIGFVSVVLASLFCVLHAKGFTSSSSPTQKQNDVASQPPSPPPEPGPSSSAVKAPRRIRWLLFLMVALLVLLILAAGVGVYMYLTNSVSPPLQEFAFFFSGNASMVEEYFWGRWFAAVSYVTSYAGSIKAYILAHGTHHSKLLFVSLATHFACLLIIAILRRVHILLLRFIRPDDICACLVAVVVIVSLPQLSWTVWLPYYIGCDETFPSIQRINWNLLCLSSRLSSLAITQFDELSVILGTTVLHAVLSICFLLFGLLSTARNTYQNVSLAGFRDFLNLFAFHTAAISIDLGAVFSVYHYSCLLPWAKQVIWNAFSSPKSRQEAKAIFWDLVREYQVWKGVQVADFQELASATPNTLRSRLCSLFEIWCDLHSMQKLIIVGPALMFYGYFYIFPTVRKLPQLFRGWCQRFNNWRYRW